jgi:WD40 repeat protein
MQVRGMFHANFTLSCTDAGNSALRRELAGHSGTVNRILLVDSTMAISSSQDATVIVWDLQTGVPRWKLESNGGIVEGLMEHENLLFTGSRDGTVRAWNLDDGQCVRVLRGHTTAVWKMAFNQNGSLLATAASGGSMRIWDAASE